MVRSSAMSSFDREHTISYSSLIETVRLSRTVFEIRRVFLSKFADFILPHLNLAPPLRVTPFEFRKDVWQQKTGVAGLSCDVVCVILSVAILIQCRLVTGTQTDRRTHRHTTTANTALA